MTDGGGVSAPGSSLMGACGGELPAAVATVGITTGRVGCGLAGKILLVFPVPPPLLLYCCEGSDDEDLAVLPGVDVGVVLGGVGLLLLTTLNESWRPPVTPLVSWLLLPL